VALAMGPNDEEEEETNEEDNLQELIQDSNNLVS